MGFFGRRDPDRADEPAQGGDPLDAERDSLRRIEAGGIPVKAEERLRALGAGEGFFASGLSVNEFALLDRQPARLLLLFSRPGFESFFTEGGAPLDQEPAGPPDLESFRRVVEKYNMELLETPGH